MRILIPLFICCLVATANVSEYKILREGPEELSTQVNKHLKDGWILYGHPYGLGLQSQAVVKLKK